MENTSGQGKLANVPAEIDNWNWGAFLANWIWGIGNNTYIAFLMFIPLVNIVMPFVLGAKGSTWAWRNKRWESVEHFRSVQRKWAKWAAIFYVVFISLIVIILFTTLNSSEPYKLGVQKIHESQKAIAALGEPITTGMPMGSFEVTGPTGSADLSFSVEGKNHNGTVYLKAVKDMGQWDFQRIELEIEGSGERIDLR